MNRKLLLSLFALFSTLSSFAQVKLADVPISNDSLTHYLDTMQKIVLMRSLPSIIRKNISPIVTGKNDELNLANYGSIDPVNGTLKFNAFGTFSKKKTTPLFNISISGDLIGTTASSLFNNSKLNSNTQITGQLHFPLKPLFGLRGSLNDLTPIREKMGVLYNAHQKKLLAIRPPFERKHVNILYQQTLKTDSKMFLKLDTLCVKLERESSQLDSMNNELIKVTEDSLKNKTLAYLSIFNEYQKVSNERHKILKQVDSLATLIANFSEVKKQEESLNENLNDQIRELFTKLPLKTEHLLWTTLSGDFNRLKYYTYDTKKPFNTIEPSHLNNFNLGVTLNYYHVSSRLYDVDDDPHSDFKPVKYSFLSFSISRIHTSDIDDYKAFELSDSRRFASGDSTRTIAKKYNAYTDSITIYKAIKLAANYYQSIGREASVALHAFSDVEFRSYKKAPMNLGLGFIVPIRSNAKPVLNIELYYKLVDIWKVLPQKQPNALKRNEIGLSLAVPFAILTK